MDVGLAGGAFLAGGGVWDADFEVDGLAWPAPRSSVYAAWAA